MLFGRLVLVILATIVNCAVFASSFGFGDSNPKVPGKGMALFRFLSPRAQLSGQFLNLNVRMFASSSIGVEDVLKSPQWPSEWPFTASDMMRQDESADSNFYSMARFCYHVDDRAIESLTAYYEEAFEEWENPSILDICSSHVSHFPSGTTKNERRRLVALGMNEEELRENKQVDEYVVKDLNTDPVLPFPDNSFDIVTNAVSIDYLNRPLEINKEVARVLKPGGVAMYALSNRCFPTKAVNIWLRTNDLEHVFIVGSYFHYTGMFEPPSAVEVGPNPSWIGGSSQNIAYLSVVRAKVNKSI